MSQSTGFSLNYYKARTAHLSAVAAVVVACFLVLFPLYWMVSTSLKPLGEALAAPPTMFPREFAFENYRDALTAAPFPRYMANSLFVGLTNGILQVILGAMAGYVIARGSFRGRALLLGAVLATMMIPFESIVIPNFVIITTLGWFDTFAALIAPWAVTPFAIFLYRQAFLALPKELFEASSVDGASEWQRFWRIGFPLVRSASVTVFLLAFVWSWGALMWPLLVTASTDMRVIQVGLFAFRTEGGIHVNRLMAATASSLLPVVLLFLVAQRFLVRAITEGSGR